MTTTHRTEDTMRYYRIENRTSGHVLGMYAGDDASDALDAMARDAGYADHAEACEVASGDDLEATEMELYGIAEVAEAIDTTPKHVATMRWRDQLPEPDAELACGPVWEAATIEPWIDEKLRDDD